MDSAADRLALLRDEIISARLSRRTVLRRAGALGLTAPVIASLLAACGGSDDEDTPPTATEQTPAPTTSPTSAAAASASPAQASATSADSAPTVTAPAPAEPSATAADLGERGGQGHLRLLWTAAAVTLNPHLSGSASVWDPARLILEPLAEYDASDTLIPVLAAEVPTVENGGLTDDGRVVTWKLREGVTWHDGEAFTAEDVVFTYEWVVNPENGAVTAGLYQGIASVEAEDDYTVVLTFEKTNPAWSVPFVSWYGGFILPEHIMQDWTGADAVNAPFNLAPVGTGPYLLSEFRPGDTVLVELNPNYWEAGTPHFDTVEVKGGGDAVSALRAVYQTGEADYAYDVRVQPQVFDEVTGASEGVTVTVTPTACERYVLQMMDPNLEIDGERSKLGYPHPFFSDVLVRRAFSHAIDRDSIATQLYGRAGTPSANWMIAPERFVSPNTTYEFNLEEAAALLDEAGWLLEDGERRKGDQRMTVLDQTSVDGVRQRTQEVVKEALESLGISVEIKAIEGSVYFSRDVGNPETAAKFYADLTAFSSNSLNPYPLSLFLFGLSRDPALNIPQLENDWVGLNYGRWINEDFNAAYTAAESELDPEQQAELFITMNDLAVNEVAVIPMVKRTRVDVHSSELEIGELTPWTSPLWDVKYWRRSAG